MEKAEKMKYWHDLGVFIQNLAFYIFGTAAMAAAAMVLLSEPIDRYYSDQLALEIQEYKNQKLAELKDQKSELLKNLDNEAIVKRAARMTLNFITSDEQTEDGDMPPVYQWQDISEAVMQAADDYPKEQELPFWAKYARLLLKNDKAEKWLLGLSAGMLVICLTCFSSKRQC